MYVKFVYIVSLLLLLLLLFLCLLFLQHRKGLLVGLLASGTVLVTMAVSKIARETVIWEDTVTTTHACVECKQNTLERN